MNSKSPVFFVMYRHCRQHYKANPIYKLIFPTTPFHCLFKCICGFTKQVAAALITNTPWIKFPNPSIHLILCDPDRVIHHSREYSQFMNSLGPNWCTDRLLLSPFPLPICHAIDLQNGIEISYTLVTLIPNFAMHSIVLGFFWLSIDSNLSYNCHATPSFILTISNKEGTWFLFFYGFLSNIWFIRFTSSLLAIGFWINKSLSILANSSFRNVS